MGVPPMNKDSKVFKDIKITICPADKGIVPLDFSKLQLNKVDDQTFFVEKGQLKCYPYLYFFEPFLPLVCILPSCQVQFQNA